MTRKAGNRMIQINGGIIRPSETKKKTVITKTRDDYPGVSQAHLDIAEVFSSPKLAGPPICDELIALMLHTFTEEEASIARHIGPRARETAESMATAAHRPVEEVRPILERLADEKSILLSFGSGENRKYTNLPLAAGSFELVGKFRRVEMKEALGIKAEAEASGLVTWITAQDPQTGGSSCSCCGCCCHMMRIITEFNMPGVIAPPYFMPRVDIENCNYCGKCALSCPMGAITINIKNKAYLHDSKRCIGCAQCAVSCSKLKAIEMVAIPGVEDFKQDRKRGALE